MSELPAVHRLFPEGLAELAAAHLVSEIGVVLKQLDDILVENAVILANESRGMRSLEAVGQDLAKVYMFLLQTDIGGILERHLRTNPHLLN